MSDDLSNLALTRVVAELYDPTSDWDDLLAAPQDHGVCCALRHLLEVDLVIFRGSMTTQDWFRDFLAVPQTTKAHPQFGPVHAGFDLGMDEAFANIQPALGRQVIVAGHSLGAARAALYAARLKAAGRPPNRILLLGCPRPGFQQFADYVADIPTDSIRNHGDLVTTVPFTIPGFPFVPAASYIDQFVSAPANDPWGPLRYHHIELYEAGLLARAA